MYNNNYMYAIERNDKYLAHYGIRGMKWGVRKAIASGNSAKLSRQYAKASKKLAKLEKRAANSKKYARRAALMGAGAAAAGGLAAAGTKGIVDVMGGATRATQGAGKALMNVRGSNKVAHKLRNLGVALNTTASKGGKMNTALGGAAKDIMKWGNSNSIGQALKSGGRKFQNANGKLVAKVTGGKGIVNTTDKLGKISNNTYARIGAGAIGAGLAVGAARNAYKAATAKKKAEKFRAAMNESFKGTKYANGGNNSSSKPRQGKKRRNRG